MNILKFLDLRERLGFAFNAQNTIISAAFVLGISSGATAVLGLLKGRLLTTFFGVSDELGVFYTADKIPNFIYSIIVLGAFSTVFIPMFTGLLQQDKKRAIRFSSYMISIGLLAFVIIGVTVMIFAGKIMSLLSLGNFTHQQVALGANLMRIMILAQLILVFSSFATSVLQSFKYFLAPALAPVAYNMGMIAGIVFLSPRYGIYGPAFGVIIGALLHLVIQIPYLLKINFSFKPSFDIKDVHVRKTFELMPPRVLSVVFNQLVATINNSLAIIISTSSVVILKFSTQLQFFPVSLFGISMAVASLPVLSENSSPQNLDRFKKIFLTTLHQMMFFVMPASAILLILRVPVVRLVYGASNFPWEATVKTSYALAFFSLSIFAQSGVYLVTRAFYSLKDTVTPVKVALFTIFINVGLSVFFVKVLGLGVWAIALSYSTTSILDFLILVYLLTKKLGGFDKERLLVPFIKIGYATVLMSISLYLPLKVLDQFVFDTTKTINLLMLTVIATVAGIVSYLFFTWLLKVKEIELLYKILIRLKLREALPKTPSTIIAGE